MGLFDKLKKKFNRNETIYMPVIGKLISLEAIADGVFSAGILGKGAGIEPEDGMVYAPFDGKIVQIADTKHAIGLESENGVELLIHVGMDTVEMNGKGFDLLVHEGDSVTQGQKLMSFSMDAIQEAGYRTTIAVIVTNSDQFESIVVSEEGNKQLEEAIIQVG
jgi:glucose-specific phosphotransferase system IIA component